MKTILQATTLALLTQTILLGSNLDWTTTTCSTSSAKVEDDFYMTLGLPSPASSLSLSSSTNTHTSARSTPSIDLSSLLSKIQELDEENTCNDELGAHSEAETSNKTTLLRGAIGLLTGISPEAILENINAKTDESSRALLMAYESYKITQETKQLQELIQSLKRAIRSKHTSKERLQTACGLLYILDCHLLCNEGLDRLLSF